MWKLVRRAVLIGALIVFGALQVVPYGRAQANPPVSQEPSWDSVRTRQLTVRACYDCHSNQTTWPWYASIAPMSWLIQRDVDKGRQELNFSEWDRPQKEARESGEQVRRGKMPQWYYVALHPEANLTPVERDDLIRGLEATLGRGEGRERGR